SERTNCAAKNIDLGLVSRLNVLQHGGFEGGGHVANEILAPGQDRVCVVNAHSLGDQYCLLHQLQRDSVCPFAALKCAVTGAKDSRRLIHPDIEDKLTPHGKQDVVGDFIGYSCPVKEAA